MKPEDFKPIGNYLLVKLVPVKDATSGGVILTNVARKREQIGTVYAVGSQVQFCKVGDKVHLENGEFKLLDYGNFSEDGDFAITKETCIIGVYENE